MGWDSGLLPEQREAACETGCHVCLLAGPGTGKTTTLSRRVLYLVRERGASAGQILSLTFTRAAAHELRQRAMSGLEGEASNFPRVSTLHSFALS
jgi:DNA helicase-2/ATP-dependent DNA helicase PcrA